MYLGQDPASLQAMQQELKMEAGKFPARVLVGSLSMFFLIYWFLIRR